MHSLLSICIPQFFPYLYTKKYLIQSIQIFYRSMMPQNASSQGKIPLDEFCTYYPKYTFYCFKRLLIFAAIEFKCSIAMSWLTMEATEV